MSASNTPKFYQEQRTAPLKGRFPPQFPATAFREHRLGSPRALAGGQPITTRTNAAESDTSLAPQSDDRVRMNRAPGRKHTGA